MTQKNCHIKTRGEACELKTDPCFFNISNFALPYLPSISHPWAVECLGEAAAKETNEYCKCHWEEYSREQYKTFTSTCAQKIKESAPTINLNGPSEPLLNICILKCGYLISVGEFIERYLHVPGADPDPENYLKEIYCKDKDNENMDCLENMQEFYYEFYGKLDKPCTTNCVINCINKGGPPEFYSNSQFNYDIYIPLTAYTPQEI